MSLVYCRTRWRYQRPTPRHTLASHTWGSRCCIGLLTLYLMTPGCPAPRPYRKDGGESMATRFSEPSRLFDSPGVIGVWGAGVRNVVHAGPKTLGVPSPLACTVLGVGGYRAGS